MPEGVICGFRNPKNINALNINSALNNAKAINTTVLIFGIGISLADTIMCGISQNSFSAALKRGTRCTLVILSSLAAGVISSGLGPIGSGVFAFATGKFVDSLFEMAGW